MFWYTKLRIFIGVSKEYFKVVYSGDTAVAYLVALAKGKYLYVSFFERIDDEDNDDRRRWRIPTGVFTIFKGSANMTYFMSFSLSNMFYSIKIDFMLVELGQLHNF